MIDSCSSAMPGTITINTSNIGLLKHVSQLESRMEQSFDIITIREIRSITELSLEVRSSRTFSENLSLKEEILRLKEKN